MHPSLQNSLNSHVGPISDDPKLCNITRKSDTQKNINYEQIIRLYQKKVSWLYNSQIQVMKIMYNIESVCVENWIVRYTNKLEGVTNLFKWTGKGQVIKQTKITEFNVSGHLRLKHMKNLSLLLTNQIAKGNPLCWTEWNSSFWPYLNAIKAYNHITL